MTDINDENKEIICKLIAYLETIEGQAKLKELSVVAENFINNLRKQEELTSEQLFLRVTI